MAEFIHRQNLRHYREELSTSPGGPRQRMLLWLMANEIAKAAREGWAAKFD
jgi:hypothetical protein